MLGLMQHHPLLVSSLLEHAATAHPDAALVSYAPGQPVHRCGWPDIDRRARKLAQALQVLGVRPGDRVGVLAWNSYRFLELLYGVSGMGAVLHTANPRLFHEQIAYIVTHAGDEVLFLDPGLLPLVEALAPKLTTVRHYVVMTDRAHLPPSTLPGLLCHDELLEAHDGDYAWPVLDERAACALCYTSGTTGHPKGVLYSHRSTLLHAMTLCMPDVMHLSAADTLFMAAPMFHVNAWGTPYACALAGASAVLPGPALDGASIYRVMQEERVTTALGVPTVWMALQQHAAAAGLEPRRDLCLERVLIGGAAAPRAVIETFETTWGTRVVHGWGMTETSPLATASNPKRKHRDATAEERVALLTRQGRVPFGVQIRLVDDDGRVLPNDGTAVGRLMVRGHWIVDGYFAGDGGTVVDDDRWFDTGDIATIDPDGFMQITDRAKDLVKSGGEWISSIALENAAVGHPAVAEAAVIAIPHPRWQERPLMIVVTRPGREVTKEELLAFLADRVAKWWLPDDVVFVDELPHTATGKLLKTALRERFSGYRFVESPDAGAGTT